MPRPKKSKAAPTAREIGNTMAVALARTMLQKGVLAPADIVGMVEEMDRVAAAAQDTLPAGAEATRRGAAAFRHALGRNPGIAFPLVLTAD